MELHKFLWLLAIAGNCTKRPFQPFDPNC